MKKSVALAFGALLFAASPAIASGGLKVMNFNTMCSFCDHEPSNGPWAQRIKDLADTVERHDPDLISFQEFSWPHHVNQMSKMLGDRYEALFKRGTFFPTTDATLFVRKDRFEVLEYQGIWLGPKSPRFNFGWKIGSPRRFVWVRLLDRATGLEFIFSGSHFDNAGKNKGPTAEFVQEFFKKQTLPLIFAADTNLDPTHNGYRVLVGQNMRNTFDEKGDFTVASNSPFDSQELCPDDPTPWPMCRIDHVLLSNNAPWKVKTWGEDLFRYYKGTQFVSDHRAVIVELE